MKRKQTREKPVWQDQPMGELVILMDGWELLKAGFAKSKDLPEAHAFLQEWIAGLSADRQMYVGWMDSIIPAARSEIAAWLNPRARVGTVAATEAVAPNASDIPATMFLVIVRLWERFLAVGELGCREDQTRWLSEKSREEQLLLTRLSKRITLPNS